MRFSLGCIVFYHVKMIVVLPVVKPLVEAVTALVPMPPCPDKTITASPFESVVTRTAMVLLWV